MAKMIPMQEKMQGEEEWYALPTQSQGDGSQPPTSLWLDDPQQHVGPEYLPGDEDGPSPTCGPVESDPGETGRAPG